MKWLIASDIHGSARYCRMLLDCFAREQADRLLLLGDILYHGPRNDLPEEYNPHLAASLLNEYAEKIVCVRGNCDSEVDQMVLSFPLAADYAVIDTGASLIYATHGHIFNEDHPLNMCRGSVLICGHFHVPVVRQHETYLYLNTGSVSLPKEQSYHSYVVFDGDRFVWKDAVSREEKLTCCLPAGCL